METIQGRKLYEEVRYFIQITYFLKTIAEDFDWVIQYVLYEFIVRLCKDHWQLSLDCVKVT